MKLISVNNVETNRYKLEVEVDGKTFEDAIQKIFRKESKKIAIPGFRKGKAPRSFIEKYYGSDIFFEEAIRETYPEALESAVYEAKLDFVNDEVDFDIQGEISKDGYTFTAVITTKPEVEIDGYKGIEVEKKSAEVTEDDINNEIKSVQDRNARTITVEDRPAQKDDITLIDFEGFIDGVAFEGGKGENYPLTLGSGQFIPGFEEQIIGHNVGDEFDVNVSFPNDYQAENLKAKDAVFKCKLHELKMRELPQVDDEFVKDVSEFDTLDEYKEDISKKLKEDKEKQAEKEFEDQIVEKLCDLVKAEIPKAMFDNKINEDLRDFEYRLKSQGLSIETYMQYTGMDAEAMKNGFKDQAEKQVKTRLALEKIATLENIEISDEDMENEYKKISEQYKLDLDKVKGMISKEDLSKDILVEKALNIVKEEAKVK